MSPLLGRRSGRIQAITVSSSVILSRALLSMLMKSASLPGRLAAPQICPLPGASVPCTTPLRLLPLLSATAAPVAQLQSSRRQFPRRPMISLISAWVSSWL